eukprot:TRINITY_DN71177_c0_g1_i1.p3 TRINITY_DN71177_c0_g1~~TRINITY_DN71177_c0_g1_i1.p3  ORF type:complete len:103 (-),score=10.19 TRINITY_DN71177_c0_g1_i1:168-476(-)
MSKESSITLWCQGRQYQRLKVRNGKTTTKVSAAKTSYLTGKKHVHQVAQTLKNPKTSVKPPEPPPRSPAPLGELQIHRRGCQYRRIVKLKTPIKIYAPGCST